jgi:hypothetical protein
MKERPILFSGPMVRALLDGKKTQTRRLIKPQPPHWHWSRVREYAERDGLTFQLPGQDYWVKPPPFGKPGDRLWVKETFVAPVDGKPVYRASIPYGNLDCHFKPWRPSIFMPRKASRITLEITSIRVERLNDISEEDAKAEGAEIQKETPGGWVICGPRIGSYREGYRWLWEQINGADSWDANPWVWAITFKRITP